MKYQIAHQPSYALAKILLEPGEEIRTEAGVMVTMSADLILEAKMNSGNSSGGGLLGNAFSALKKAVLTDESFFVTTIRADNVGGEVTLAPHTPGDINVVKVDRPILVHAHAYLASKGVDVNTRFNGFQSMIGGEGLFFLRVSGHGTLFMTSFGALEHKTLAAGERLVVHHAHMVAFHEGMAMTTRMAANNRRAGLFKRIATSAVTHEGLVMEFEGPGDIWIQTRNAHAFAHWVYDLLPHEGDGSDDASQSAVGNSLRNAVGNIFTGND